MSINTIQVEREVSKVCRRASCSGPEFWNIQHNSLLNLEFTKQTKAFADDLLLAVKAESIWEAENITNIEMGKILIWAKNKIKFNEQK
jgi:hypothetical protein